MQKQELEIDKMIIVFIDYNRQQLFSEDIKTLATKKKKDKSAITKKRNSMTLSFIKKNK